MRHSKPFQSLSTFCKIPVHPRIIKGSHHNYLSITDISTIDCPICLTEMINSFNHYLPYLPCIPSHIEGKSILIDSENGKPVSSVFNDQLTMYY